jgi:hypothetical protein
MKFLKVIKFRRFLFCSLANGKPKTTLSTAIHCQTIKSIKLLFSRAGIQIAQSEHKISGQIGGYIRQNLCTKNRK